MKRIKPQPGNRLGAGLRLENSRGMTLIEVLVVIIIAAGMAGGGVFMLGLLSQGNLKSEARGLATAMQFCSEQAALNNRHYRLVIDLDNNSYRTELIDSDVVIDESSEEAAEAFDEGMLPEELRDQEAEEEQDDDLFDDDEHDPFGVSRRTGDKDGEDAVLEEHSLEDGVSFVSVRTESRSRAATTGRVAVSFFSNGRQQEAMIVLEDSGGGKYTLISEPLTGRVRIYTGEKDDPDDFGPEQYDG